MTLDILALICVLGQSPRECVPQTARETIKLGEATSDLACMIQSQQSAARVAMLYTPRPEEWTKVMCVRR